MSDSFEFTLHSPLTKEDWNKISDAEYERTMSVTIQTPQGRQVRYIKCEVLDKIRTDLEKEIIPRNSDQYDNEAKWQNMGLRMALKVIDKYKAEGEMKKE